MVASNRGVGMNRRTLSIQFQTLTNAAWKTLVLEAHVGTGSPAEFLGDVFGGSCVQPTEDVHLHQITLSDEVSFVVDDLDGRFWSFHSTSSSGVVRQAVQARVSRRRDLDFVWLPTQHLQCVRPDNRPSFVKADFNRSDSHPAAGIQDLSISIHGADANQLLESVSKSDRFGDVFSISRIRVPITDDDHGFVEQAINRKAYFASRGDSFALHQQVVAEVVARYRAFVEAVEARSMKFCQTGQDSGGTLKGVPLEIRFSRPIPSVRALFEELFSSREPFRLWGMFDADEYHGDCDAVDLHIGTCLRVEAGREFLRVHIHDGACGNTFARLVSCLQHCVDGALRIVEPELDALLRPDPAPTPV